MSDVNEMGPRYGFSGAKIGFANLPSIYKQIKSLLTIDQVSLPFTNYDVNYNEQPKQAFGVCVLIYRNFRLMGHFRSCSQTMMGDLLMGRMGGDSIGLAESTSSRIKNWVLAQTKRCQGKNRKIVPHY